MDIEFLQVQHPTWTNEIDHLYTLLGGAQNPTLFPYHFLQTVLPRIGGAVGIVRQERATVAIGFLFPSLSSTTVRATERAYTLRYHVLPGSVLPDLQLFSQVCKQHLAGQVFPYDPQVPHTYRPSHQSFGLPDIGRPDQTEAMAIRTLQQQIWGSPPEFLYPADIHSTEFGLGSSLIARIDGSPAGFLFGFLKFRAPKETSTIPVDWYTRFHGSVQLESQALGVLPLHRGARLGFLLKKAQAQQALHAGIQIISWTVDPLQWPNAMLNFGLLRAVACHFSPDYYPFRNELNRVTASRFSLTWLVGSERVRSHCKFETNDATHIQPVILDLDQAKHIQRVNDGCSQIDTQIDAQIDTNVTADQIAIEIPADWTAIQREQVDEAVRWRAATDTLFQRIIGSQPGQYAVTDVGVAGARRYLVAERINENCRLRLGR